MNSLAKDLAKIDALEMEIQNKGSEPTSIDTTTVQYKALVRRLKKYDNPKTDAVRMVLYYLEEKGEFKAEDLDKYLK